MPAPRASIDNIEVQSRTRLFNTWAMKVPHTLAQVLAPDYFADCTLIGMRRGDLVNLLLEDGESLQHVRLVVTAASARDRLLRVGLLHITGEVAATETGDQGFVDLKTGVVTIRHA